jgi:hypothetical protein
MLKPETGQKSKGGIGVGSWGAVEMPKHPESGSPKEATQLMEPSPVSTLGSPSCGQRRILGPRNTTRPRQSHAVSENNISESSRVATRRVGEFGASQSSRPWCILQWTDAGRPMRPKGCSLSHHRANQNAPAGLWADGGFTFVAGGEVHIVPKGTKD